MANQSKSMVFGFVIIAAIIFAVALGYKMTQGDTPTTQKTKSPVAEKQTTEKNKEPEIKVVSYEEDTSEPMVFPTPAEQAETENKAPYFMDFAMRFHSGKEALQAIPNFIKNGQDKKAHYLVKFIETQFPDTEIPDKFANL